MKQMGTSMVAMMATTAAKVARRSGSSTELLSTK